MKKVILLNPNPGYAHGVNKATITPPLGLAYLAAVLQKSGHKAQIIDCNILGIEPEEIAGNFAFKPDLIGISANIVTYRGAVECAEKLKSQYAGTPIILGGPYCSAAADDILNKSSAVDAVAVGEGEATLTEVVDSLGKGNRFEGIKGLVYRDKSGNIHNGARGLIENLDDIPPPAYNLLPEPGTYRTRGRANPVGFIFTSRGCPAHCTFCNRNIFGTRWRPHSADRVIENISYLVERYGIKQLNILDDNFTFNKKRTEEILDRLIKMPFKLCIDLQNGIRIDRVDESLLTKMKKAGVFKIGLGVESANSLVQQRVKKKVNLQRAVALTRYARSLGIVTVGFFMIGLPGDNKETMKETIDFAIKMNPHFVNISICTPFPGTELYEEIKERGEFLKNVDDGIDAGYFGGRAFFKLDSMNPKEVESCFQLSYRRFYMRPSKVIDVLSTFRSIEELKWLMNAAKEIL